MRRCSAECNALIRGHVPRPPRESDPPGVTPAGADDHMVTRFFSGVEVSAFLATKICSARAGKDLVSQIWTAQPFENTTDDRTNYFGGFHQGRQLSTIKDLCARIPPSESPLLGV